jgi:hypothetical protein
LAKRNSFKSKDVDIDKWNHYSSVIDNKLNRIRPLTRAEDSWNRPYGILTKVCHIALPKNSRSRQMRPAIAIKFHNIIRMLRKLLQKRLQEHTQSKNTCAAVQKCLIEASPDSPNDLSTLSSIQPDYLLAKFTNRRCQAIASKRMQSITLQHD